MAAVNITRAEAARELLRRQRARESLVDFSQAIDIPGAPVSEDPDEWLFKPIESSVAAHHRLILGKVQECLEKPFGRLIIMAPPGSAKSTYAGVVAPAWALGKWPGYNMIYASHSNPPAERMSRRTRQICNSPEYAAIWEHEAILEHGNKAVREWKLTNDSTILNSGLEAGITSSRADAAILDDVIGGAEHANSVTQRDATWQAYQFDLITRLKPHASIIFIMTRWHEDDPVGRLLPTDYAGQSGPVECQDGQVWEIINLPAECERKDDPLGRKPGEMLWPQWFTERHWALYRRNSRLWSALFQQRPAPDTGGQFERGWFQRYTKRPDKWPSTDERHRELSWVMSTDFAQTTPDEESKGRVDWTRHGVFGITPDLDIYYEHGLGFQKAPDQTIEQGIDMVRDYQPTDWLLEAGGIYNAWNGYITRRMRERTKKEGRRCLTTLVKMPSNNNKIVKASAFRAMCQAGKVWVKEGQEGDDFITELCAFPYGIWDDRVDMAGQIGRHADEMYTEEPEPEPVRKVVRHLSAAAAEAREIDDEEVERRRRDFMG